MNFDKEKDELSQHTQKILKSKLTPIQNEVYIKGDSITVLIRDCFDIQENHTRNKMINKLKLEKES